MISFSVPHYATNIFKMQLISRNSGRKRRIAAEKPLSRRGTHFRRGPAFAAVSGVAMKTIRFRGENQQIV